MRDKESWAPLQPCTLLLEGPNGHHGDHWVTGWMLLQRQPQHYQQGPLALSAPTPPHPHVFISISLSDSLHGL